MNSILRSVYATPFKEFVEMKRTLGYKYATGEIIVTQLDKLAERRGEQARGITREFAEEWAIKRNDESNKYHYDRIRLLAEVSAFIIEQGHESFVPRVPRHPSASFVPYIFTDHEIAGIFTAFDNYMLNRRTMNSEIICFPALIRLLYSTGIRIGEAVNLSLNDVDLDNHCILISDSKNGQERIIPISTTLAVVLQDYLKHRNLLPTCRRNDYFFIKLNGEKICKNIVAVWFRKCLSSLSITYDGKNQSRPRLHDLRHTFAVNALANMVKSGVDIYVSLPILSNYLGHSLLESTNQYVRLTANVYPDIIRDVNTVCIDILPKLRKYEAD